MRLSRVHFDKQQLDKILGYETFKGSFTPTMIILGNIHFEPGDVVRHNNHPIVEIQLQGVVAEAQGDKLIQKPTWGLTTRNVFRIQYQGYEMWDDPGANVHVLGMGTEIIKNGTETGT